MGRLSALSVMGVAAGVWFIVDFPLKMVDTYGVGFPGPIRVRSSDGAIFFSPTLRRVP